MRTLFRAYDEDSKDIKVVDLDGKEFESVFEADTEHGLVLQFVLNKDGRLDSIGNMTVRYVSFDVVNRVTGDTLASHRFDLQRCVILDSADDTEFNAFVDAQAEVE